MGPRAWISPISPGRQFGAGLRVGDTDLVAGQGQAGGGETLRVVG